MTSIYNITPSEGGFSNPSVAHWKDNLFVCIYTKNSKTYLALLRDTNNDFSNLEYTITDDPVTDGHDAKILKNKNNKFEIAYKINVNGVVADNVVNKITFTINDNLSFDLSDDTIICTETKYWTFLVSDGGFYFSNVLDKCHTVYQIEKEGESRKLCTNPFIEKIEACEFFTDFKKYYSDMGVGIDYIIPSSPSIKIKESFISVGMIKFKDFASRKSNADLNHFNNLISYSDTFLFFYKFSMQSGRILGISPFFIPFKRRLSSISAGGLTEYGDKIIMSYCENNSECKFLSYNSDELLQKVIVDHNKLPNDHAFAFLKQ